MKIAAISDTHGLEFNRPWANVFIHAGDMTAWGEYPETLVLGRKLAFEGTEDGMPPYDEVILVPGNHDNALAAFPKSELWTFSKHTHLLIDQAWEYNGLVFYGSPWTPRFVGQNPQFMAFTATEDQMRDRFENIPAEVDVLITHGPPKGILDNGQGSEALREAVERRRIRVHLFGHVHEQGGQFKVNYPQDGGTRESYNISSIAPETRPTRGRRPKEIAWPPMEFELQGLIKKGPGTRS